MKTRRNGNGFTPWAMGAFRILLVGLLGWVLVSVVNLREVASKREVVLESIHKELSDLNRKVDRLERKVVDNHRNGRIAYTE